MNWLVFLEWTIERFTQMREQCVHYSFSLSLSLITIRALRLEPKLIQICHYVYLLHCYSDCKSRWNIWICLWLRHSSSHILMRSKWEHFIQSWRQTFGVWLTTVGVIDQTLLSSTQSLHKSSDRRSLSSVLVVFWWFHRLCLVISSSVMH